MECHTLSLIWDGVVVWDVKEKKTDGQAQPDTAF